MKPVLVIFLLSILSITACSSSSTPKTQYYLLNSPTSNVIKNLKNTIQQKELQDKNSPQIMVKLLPLPDYLTQPNLVLQLSNHQLHYSLFNMWAEPLSVGFTQALTHDLNQTNGSLKFVVNPQRVTTDNADIFITITAFQPTHLSQVILAGSYTISSKNQTSPIIQKSYTNDFTFTVELNDNGYAHSVEKMRDVVSLLAQELSEKTQESM